MKYSSNEVNLHTHSFYCGHGSGQLKDFICVAREKGLFKVLGFSEHCPVPNDSLPSRMPISMFDSYISDIDELKSTEKDIRILKGVECDWDERYTGFYRDYVKEQLNFDYLIGSVHHMKDFFTEELTYICHMKTFGVKELLQYTKSYTQALESGLFIIGCHPDLFFGGYRKWDENTIAVSKDIIQCAKQNNIVLELNDLGFRKKQIETENGLKNQYSILEFWTMARDMNVTICTNTDAHFPKDTCGFEIDGFPNASHKFASENGIKLTGWDISINKDFSTSIKAVN